ncbi:Rha family transcriptional regulator [Bartonella sp. DGB1]|uniref:Rha family transcriptional regulator n=1 Tax=Bartonella sp. DGB1 TaxID=3239807 RepID=UPI0035241E1E
MSSHEIATLCNKRHDNVMRDIKKMLEDLYAEKDLLKFEGIYFDKYKKQQKCYHLPKRECLILVSGYSTTLRAKIVDRWLELEQQHVIPIAKLAIEDQEEVIYQLPADERELPIRIKDCIRKHAEQLSNVYRLEAEKYLTKRTYGNAVGSKREVTHSKIDKCLKTVLYLDVVDTALAQNRISHHILFTALRASLTRDIKAIEKIHLSADKQRGKAM